MRLTKDKTNRVLEDESESTEARSFAALVLINFRLNELQGQLDIIRNRLGWLMVILVLLPVAVVVFV